MRWGDVIVSEALILSSLHEAGRGDPTKGIYPLFLGTRHPCLSSNIESVKKAMRHHTSAGKCIGIERDHWEEVEERFGKSSTFPGPPAYPTLFVMSALRNCVATQFVGITPIIA